MSKYQFVSSVRREIDGLNSAVGLRIVRRRIYRDLVRRHKKLTHTLRMLERKRGSGILSFFFS